MAIYGKVIKLKEAGSLTPWRTDHTSSELTIFRISKQERRIFCYTWLFWFNLLHAVKPNLSQYKALLKKVLILAFNRVQVTVEELVLYGQVGLSPKLDGKYNVRISLNVYSLTKRLNSCPRLLSLQGFLRYWIFSAKTGIVLCNMECLVLSIQSVLCTKEGKK